MDKPPDVNKGPVILIACCICVACAVVMVALRAFVRLRMFKMGGWDDICIAAAMTVMLVELAIIIPSVSLGAGRHVQYLDPKDNIQGLRLNFVTQPLCLVALCLTKLSVGFFLLRLTPSKRHVRIIWGVMILTLLSWLGNFLTVLLQCQPLRKVWDLSQPGRCIPQNQLKIAAFFNSSVSALTDLIFALLPIPLVRRLQMNRRTKVAIIAILSLGIFVTACAIIKMNYLGSYGEHGDFLFDSSEITIW
ncbi:hypothetical protein D0869_04142 [Hortaea werneckii]|uniref:Rhodopsin domain-containing protein n=1 Tax=Hortaea werneckii TaxID=91943 RepID=A0A3M6X2M4_HORWE|nr:hypothetical protein D0869_04142 [Hortaea werneckii]RMY07994.1 hypothetical protein D0868_05053 [Hortaea werneckii]